uniref:Uncharacterized protein n=1 Tax=Lygus hesperus TaxID=30085 RepID=A0A146LWM0_LYGHE
MRAHHDSLVNTNHRGLPSGTGPTSKQHNFAILNFTTIITTTTTTTSVIIIVTRDSIVVAVIVVRALYVRCTTAYAAFCRYTSTCQLKLFKQKSGNLQCCTGGTQRALVRGDGWNLTRHLLQYTRQRKLTLRQWHKKAMPYRVVKCHT